MCYGLIFDLRMNDDSRHFADLPATRDWDAIRNHVVFFPGARLTGFVSDGVTEAWIEFSFRGERFSVNDQFGAYWFFVENPKCDDSILVAVSGHWQRLLCDPDSSTDTLPDGRG